MPDENLREPGGSGYMHRSTIMLFWKKERQVEGAIEAYIEETERCLSSFGEAFEVYFEEGLCERFEQLVEETHRLEGSADEKRRDLETAMYDKALIPESRGDILGMLEALDLVPNKCESVLYQVWTQNMTVPGPFAEQVHELVKVNVESYTALCRTMRDLFHRVKQVISGAALVSDGEARSDEIERRLIKAIFDSDEDKADKILLKELVLEIGAISDRAENAADRLRNIAVKRQS